MRLKTVTIALQLCRGMGRFCRVHLRQLPQKGPQKGQRDEQGERVRNGLAELHAHKSQHPGQYKNQRDKAHALPAAGQKGGTPGLAHALKGHVGHYDHRLQKDGKALVAEGGQRHGGDGGVIAEQTDEDIAVHPAQAHQHYQCLAMLLHPIIVVANMTFQSVGASGRATFLACCRQGVFFIPLILILPRTHGLFGVEICQPIADVLTFLVSLPFLIAFLQQLGRMDDAEQTKASS